MKIFVTGATGFVGSHLVEKLLNEGHEVWALVRKPNLIRIEDQKLKLILIEGNLESHLNLSDEEKNSFDVVIHTAGVVHSFDSETFFKINTEGTKNIINAFKDNLKLKFIFISSLAARGPNQENPDEQPVSDYGRSKRLAEDYFTKDAPAEWNKIIIRPPMVIGPGDTAVLDIFKMVKGRFILLPGTKSREKVYSFVCVFDLVNTIIKSIDLNQSALLYSSYPKTITFQELIEEINKKMPYKQIIYIPIPEILILIFAYTLFLLNKIKNHQLRMTPDKTHELFPTTWICDSSKTSSLLNQNFEYDLNKTVTITFEDYLERNWI